MTTVQYTNTDDFKISGNWEIFAKHIQEKFAQDSDSNISAVSIKQNESIVNSDEMQQIRS